MLLQESVVLLQSMLLESRECCVVTEHVTRECCVVTEHVTRECCVVTEHVTRECCVVLLQSM